MSFQNGITTATCLIKQLIRHNQQKCSANDAVVSYRITSIDRVYIM